MLSLFYSGLTLGLEPSQFKKERETTTTTTRSKSNRPACWSFNLAAITSQEGPPIIILSSRALAHRYSLSNIIHKRMSTPRSPPQLITSRDHDDDVIGTQTQWHQSQRPHRQRRNHNTNPLHSIQSTLDEICTQITDKLSLANAKQLLPPHPPPYHTLLPSFISGTLAFYATSFSSQYLQYKLLKMSTGTRPTIIPMTVGVVTVAVGSWMGHLAGLGSTAAVNVATAKTKTTSSKIQWNKRPSSSSCSSWIEQCNSLLEQNIIPMKSAACQAIHEMTRPMMTIMTSNSNNYYNNNSKRIKYY